MYRFRKLEGRPDLKIIALMHGWDDESSETIMKAANELVLEDSVNFQFLIFNNQPIGVVDAHVVEPENEFAYIRSMAVMPEYRKKGIGRMIVGHMVKLFTDAGCNRIELESEIESFNFWIKTGFKPIYLTNAGLVRMKLHIP